MSSSCVRAVAVADWRGHNLVVEVITCEAAPSLLTEWDPSIADPSRSAMSAILSRVEEAVSRQAGRQAGRPACYVACTHATLQHAMRCYACWACIGWSVHRPFTDVIAVILVLVSSYNCSVIAHEICFAHGPRPMTAGRVRKLGELRSE